MENQRFEIHQYRQVVTRMRLGESDRTIGGHMQRPEPSGNS